jgi:hypothetical protein
MMTPTNLSLVSANRVVATLVALAALTTGCKAHFDHTEISQVGESETEQSIDGTSASVTVGSVLTARISPINTDGNPMIESITSNDTNVLTVFETTQPDVFAFVGMAEGATTVTLHADGETVSSLRVQVTAQ